jgi:hypothetical protein
MGVLASVRMTLTMLSTRPKNKIDIFITVEVSKWNVAG